MDIRNKIILHDKYFDSFLKLACEEGYARPEIIGFDKKYEIDLAMTVDFLGVSSKKKEVLQMLLVFDEISFLNPVVPYDLSKLQNTGLIKVVNDERISGHLDYDIIDKDLLQQIQPIIVDRLNHVFKKLYDVLELKKYKIKFSDFLSTLYKFHIIDKNDTPFYSNNELLIIDKYLSHIESQILTRPDAKFARENNIDEHTIGMMVSATYMGYLQAEIGTLLSLLDLSNNKNGVLMQSEFKFDKIINATKIPDFKDGSRIIEGYQILKLSYEKLIDKLPSLESIDDVLKIKENKQKEIKQLQEVLHEIEIDLRSGRIAALKNVDRKITNAVKDLNRNLKIQKVNRWLTYISLPIGIIETALLLPPVLGFSTGIASLGTTLQSRKTEKRNGWLQVIR